MLVVNFTAPNHMEDYVHRVGRTGRAGRKGTAYTFLTPDEEKFAPDVAQALEMSGVEVPPDVKEMVEGTIRFGRLLCLIVLAVAVIFAHFNVWLCCVLCVAVMKKKDAANHVHGSSVTAAKNFSSRRLRGQEERRPNRTNRFVFHRLHCFHFCGLCLVFKCFDV